MIPATSYRAVGRSNSSWAVHDLACRSWTSCLGFLPIKWSAQSAGASKILKETRTLHDYDRSVLIGLAGSMNAAKNVDDDWPHDQAITIVMPEG